MLPVVFNRFNCLSSRAHGGSPGASGDQTAQVSFPALKGQTVAKLFRALFLAIDALVFVSLLCFFFRCRFYLLSEPLGVDFELPSWPSDSQKSQCSLGCLNILKKINVLDPMMVLNTRWGSLGLLLGSLGGLLGALWVLYIDHRGLPDSSWNLFGPR